MQRWPLALVLLACLGASPNDKPECAMPTGPVIPDEKTARAVAKAIISAQPTSERLRKYRLNISGGGLTEGAWFAYQGPENKPKITHKEISVVMGGGGLTMRIDRCTGAISDLHYVR